MSALVAINESSAGQLAVSFFDENGNPVVPASVDYRIDCETNGTAIQAWTSAGTPAAVMTINITPAQNAIINEANSYEMKLVTVRANYGTSAEFTGQYFYRVQNLPGIP